MTVCPSCVSHAFHRRCANEDWHPANACKLMCAGDVACCRKDAFFEVQCLIQKNTQQKMGKSIILIDVCQDLPHWWFQTTDSVKWRIRVIFPIEFIGFIEIQVVILQKFWLHLVTCQVIGTIFDSAPFS